MSGGDHMPKINIDKLKLVDRNFMKDIEIQNLARVQRLQRVRKSNIITGCLVGLGVLGIYGYTICSVKQEVFLDDFNEPEKTIDPQ